jgi:hypothetical protein
MKPLERDVPLAACPDLSCGRKKHCLTWAYNTHCLKTHYRNHDEWRQLIIDKIEALRVPGYVDPLTVGMTPEQRVSVIYKMVREACAL